MSFENIRSVEALLHRRARAWTKTAHHSPLVVGQGMPVLVVLARKPFLVVLAIQDRALFRAFRLMGKHVCFQILENSSTVWMRTSPFVLALDIETSTSRHRAWVRLSRI